MSSPDLLGYSDEIDVLVVGAGMAGCSAAIAAKRTGARVLLIEKSNYPGGNATRAMVAPWQSYHACVANLDGSLPKQVIGGIAQEFVDDLVSIGASTGHITDPIGFAGSITPVDPDRLKLYLVGKLEAEGVPLALGTEYNTGFSVTARQIVDASGNASATRGLGAEYITPGNPQPMTWMFTMTGVDYCAVREQQLQHPDQFVLHPAFASLPEEHIAVSGFFDLVRDATARGDWTLPRDRLLFFSTPNPGEVLINTTRIAADHPNPHAEGLRQIQELVRFLPEHVPGFANTRLGRIADVVGQRESYRLEGTARLGVADITSGSVFPDAIARGCYPVDIHGASSSVLETDEVGGHGWYDIPLGAILSRDHGNLLAAGRCISADREGFASARVLPIAMATGQAAGMVAAWRALGEKVDTSACLSLVSLV
ncbi:MAG: FAD-dependent oxidoreductase [Planctomycetales bacterium]|nr:FAD-dependent oxidoreductase [bacterium]UNM07849.1 MAG: FAD-dependent oxidoreductase [Planctomycetales bacterium]